MGKPEKVTLVLEFNDDLEKAIFFDAITKTKDSLTLMKSVMVMEALDRIDDRIKNKDNWIQGDLTTIKSDMKFFATEFKDTTEEHGELFSDLWDKYGLTDVKATEP